MALGEALPLSVAAGAPWLAEARDRVLRMVAADRLSHALLLQGPPGIGKQALAEWIARLALCDSPQEGPCGQCPSCVQHSAGSHPDLQRVVIPEDKKQIPVEAIREMIAALQMKSYRGRRKVAIIDPAEAMNTNGFNALLKTLEEPPGDAVLVLTVSRPERLPATIGSRCQRIKLVAPSRAAALAWLQGVEPAVEWAAALALTAGAPFAALALYAAPALDKEMTEVPRLLDRPDADIVGLAERCHQRLPAERLRWIENWVTERIRKGLLGPAPDHSPGSPGLPQGLRTRHIQGLFRVLDETRAAQNALKGNANVVMLFERLFVILARELAVLRTARQGH